MRGSACVQTVKQNLGRASGDNPVPVPMAAGMLYPIRGLQLPPARAGLVTAPSSVAVVTNSGSAASAPGGR